MKPLDLSQAAELDEKSHVRWYAIEAGPDVTARFIDALFGTYDLVQRNPHIGSLYYAELLDLPGIRSIGLHRFPHRIFYREHDDGIRIGRILHPSQDFMLALRQDIDFDT